jgi:hypothetical protein
MGGMKGKECDDSSGEVLSINSLSFTPSFGIGLFAFGEALG